MTEYSTYVLVLGVEGVPHRGNNLGHLAETGVRVLTLDGSLGVTEEESVCRHWSGKHKKKHVLHVTLLLISIIQSHGINLIDIYTKCTCMMYESFYFNNSVFSLYHEFVFTVNLTAE